MSGSRGTPSAGTGSGTRSAGDRDARAPLASPDLAGVLLAGGRSSRMGRDKARLPFGETTLAGRMAALLVAAGARVLVVSGPGDAGLGLPHVPDLAPGGGPLMGLRSAVTYFAAVAPGAVVLAVPVDMPGLRVAQLETLVRAARESGAAAFRESELPVALTPAPRVLAALARAADGGAVRDFLAAVGAARPLAGERLLNLNTPQEYGELAPGPTTGARP